LIEYAFIEYAFMFQSFSCRSLLNRKKTWVPKKTAAREISSEGKSSASTFMQDLVRFLTLQLKKEGQDKDEDTHSPRGSRPI
jgi:hypothetical protein